MIVAKQANAPYDPNNTTWVKIKNRNYSQGKGRYEMFTRGPVARETQRALEREKLTG